MRLYRGTFLAAMFVVVLSRAVGAEPGDDTQSVTTSAPLSSSSSSLGGQYENDILLGVFPNRAIHSMTVRVVVDDPFGSGTDDAFCQFRGPGAPQDSWHGLHTVTFEQTSQTPTGSLDRSQAVLLCSYFTHEPNGPLDSDDFHAPTVSATDAAGKPVAVKLCELAFDEDELTNPFPGGCRQACGDAVCNGGEPTIADALAVLRASVQSTSCPLWRCDTNKSGDVTVSDAIRILQRAVGLRVGLFCSTGDLTCLD